MRINNRNAKFNFDIQETFEVGIQLYGPEVKSVREGKVILDEAFVKIINGEAYLINCHIHPYQDSATKFSATRSRKLLLHRKELLSLAGKVNSNGLTLIPVSLYNKDNIFKVEIALARGKKKWDKRDDMKKREQDREIEVEIRGKD